MNRAALALLLPALLVPAPSPAATPESPAPFALRDGDRVVFYGDSITQDGAYARFVEEYVRTRFPRWDVRFWNAGVGGRHGDGRRGGPDRRPAGARRRRSPSRPWSRSCSA